MSRRAQEIDTMGERHPQLTSQWILLALPLLMAVGCGLGDHGSGSEQSGGSSGGGGVSSAGAVGGFDAPNAAPVVAGAAAMPATLAESFCETDSLAGVAESGSRGIDFDTGDMIPLCDGWVILADQTNERIEVRNIVTGEVDSRYEVPGMPEDLELDLATKHLYITLPNDNLIASVDLLGDEDDIRIAPTDSQPTSITQSANEVLVAASDGTELRVYDKGTLGLISVSPDLVGERIVFNPEDRDLIAANSTKISRFDYASGGILLFNDDPSNGEVLDLEISPNYDRIALVNPGGSPGFLGPNVINDYDSFTVDDTFGGWKVGSGPTSAAFSPLNTATDDSDYLLASTAADLVIFDIVRHAEVSRTTPSSSCPNGSFDTVEFSRGGSIGLAKKNCGTQRGTEFHWIAPAGGFGNSTSLIGVDAVALATVLPTLEAAPLCSVDDLSSLTASSTGALVIPRANDIEPLCNGWVFVAESPTNRVRLINVISGVTLAEWDLPDCPGEMVLDELNKFLFVAMPGGGGVARIDLAGPNLGEAMSARVGGFPTSLTVGNDNTIWSLGHFEIEGSDELGGENRITDLDALSMAVGASFVLRTGDPEESDTVLFSSGSTQIAFDRTTDQLFVSDEVGFARFTLIGGAFELSNPEEDIFDTLNSEIIVASPDDMSIALVDQNADLVYDFDTGAIADVTSKFWEVESQNEITAIAFDAASTVFGVATTNELILFNAEGDQAEIENFTPNDCGSDVTARAAISRGGTVGLYKTNCNVDPASETIYWNEF